MTDPLSPSDTQPEIRLGAVGRALLAALGRGETTLSAIEQEIGDILNRSGVAEPTLLADWAGLVFALSQSETTPPSRHSRANACRRGSRKGQRLDSGHSDQLVAALAVGRLQELQWNRRKDLVQRDHQNFRGPAVAKAFLAEALSSLPADAEASARWAGLASLAAGIDQRHYCVNDVEQASLGLRADLYQANAIRCTGALDEAEVALQRAIVEARTIDLRDPTFWAEAKWFVASLRRAQRRFPDAIREAHLSAALWRQGENPTREVLSLWQITSIYEQIGEPAAALRTIRRATAKAQELDDPKLSFGVRHGEVACLARAGLYASAAEAYEALMPEYINYPTHDGPRLTVLALIAAGQGRVTEADSYFRSSRSIFLAGNKAYDAALVTLDWSLFLLDQNRPEEVLPLAVSMGQAFEALGVARETLASWAIFQVAAERRELTRAVAESVVRTLGEERVGAKTGR
jgi:tetratricopeptide (TPR) repeat protein